MARSSASRLAALVALVALASVAVAEGNRHARSNPIAFPGPEAFEIISGLRPNNFSGSSRPTAADNSVNRQPTPSAPAAASSASSNNNGGGANECSPYGLTATTDDPREAVEAMFHMGKRLESLLRDPSTTNLLHSPASLVVALGQLALAARGRTLEQLERLLGCGEAFHASMKAVLARLPPRSPQTELSVRNGLFHQPPPVGRTLASNFTSKLVKYYGTEIFAADFRSSPIFAQQQVNQWAQKASKGKIDQLVPFIPPRTTTAIMTSVVYFKAKWENQFNKKYTYKGTFFIDGDHRGRTKMVDFMSAEFELPYTESPELGIKMVVLPYEGNDTAMFIVMPLGSSHWKRPRPQQQSTHIPRSEDNSPQAARERRRRERQERRRRQQQQRDCAQGKCRRSPEDLPEGQSPFSGAKVHEIAGRLSASQFQSLASAALKQPPVKVSLFLPRLSMKNNVRMREALAALGADAIFGSEADFSGAAADGEAVKWAVDEVLQESRLEVTEEGTEAASGTAVLIVDYSLDAASFRANSPFIAVIQHLPTGAPLFWATVADPS